MESSEDRVLSVIKSRAVESELKKAQNLLKERRDLYHRLFENSRDAIYITDRSGEFVDVNPAFLDLFGYTKTELIKLNAKRFYVEKNKRTEFISQIERNEFVKDYEVKLRRSNGTIIDCLESADVRVSQDGIIIGYQGILHDITESKKVNEAMNALATTLSSHFGEELFDSVSRHLAISLQVDYAFVGELSESEKNIKVVGGYAKGEIMERVEYAIKDTPCENVIDKTICRYLSGVQKLFPKDHLLTEMSVESYMGVPLFDKKGKAIGILVIMDSKSFKNVKAAQELFTIFSDRIGAEIVRIKSEENLHKSEERFRSLVDSAFNAIISTDEDGNIVSWNMAAEKIFGYYASEMIGESLVKIMPGDYHNAHQEGMKRIIQGGESKIIGKTVKLKGLRKNGSEFPIELSLSTWKSKGKSYFTGIIEDTTERLKIKERLDKEHELVLEANKELRKAFAKEERLRSALTNAEKLASLGEMASKIAHEINNPLTVIKAQAEIRAQMVTDKALKESLLMIKAKADQIKVLTRGYMNLAKPEEVELREIKLRDVLKTTVRTLLPLGQLKHIKISEEYMKDEPSIYGDSGRLEQVFRNLIINAVDAMAGKSSSEIRIGTKLSEDRKSVDAYVKDNGVGIEPENIEKIFEPYYTKKERAAGTGLGLVIVKETTENVHGGKLKVVSNIGEGTTFHVIIPSEKYSQLKKKLLIVDDDVSIAGLLAQYFIHKGLSVNTAENGKIALDTIKKFKPDLILSDIEMPELDGFGLVDEARKMNPGQRFVMMTGFDDRADSSARLKEINIPLIMKPPDLEDELWPIIKEKLEIA